MIYQAEDKALVAAYLAAEGVAGSRSHEITGEALDLPYPVWAAIRAAYYDKAVAWHQGREAARNGVKWWDNPHKNMILNAAWDSGHTSIRVAA